MVDPRPSDQQYRPNPASFLDVEAEVDPGEAWESGDDLEPEIDDGEQVGLPDDSHIGRSFDCAGFIEDTSEGDEVDGSGQLHYRELDQQWSQAQKDHHAKELVRLAQRFAQRFAKDFAVPHVQHNLDIQSDYSTRGSSQDVFEAISESITSRLWRVSVKVTAPLLGLLLNSHPPPAWFRSSIVEFPSSRSRKCKPPRQAMADRRHLFISYHSW